MSPVGDKGMKASARSGKTRGKRVITPPSQQASRVSSASSGALVAGALPPPVERPSINSLYSTKPLPSGDAIPSRTRDRDSLWGEPRFRVPGPDRRHSQRPGR